VAGDRTTRTKRGRPREEEGKIRQSLVPGEDDPGSSARSAPPPGRLPIPNIPGACSAVWMFAAVAAGVAPPRMPAAVEGTPLRVKDRLNTEVPSVGEANATFCTSLPTPLITSKGVTVPPGRNGRSGRHGVQVSRPRPPEKVILN